MKSFIVYPTALELWMKFSVLKTTKNREYYSGTCGFNKNDLLKTADLYNLKYPIHIALPYGTAKISENEFVSHVISRNLPEKSFVKISENIFVASPELCFLQAAAALPLCNVVEIGNNLCGTYYFSDTTECGQKSRQPLSTVDSIEKFLQRADHMNGLYRARIAVKYILPHSHSPYESKIAAAARLPLYHGGFALPVPELNYSIKLTNNAANFLKRESCVCDIVWPTEKVIVEYDSNLTHLNIDQHYYDKARATALVDSGYTLITATASQFKSFVDYEELFRIIQKKLQKKRQQQRMDKYRQKRYEVFRGLFKNSPTSGSSV